MKQLFSFFILLVFFLGCAEDKSNPTSSTPQATNPFSGSWSIVFAGSYTGSGSMAISSQGTFSVNVLLADSTGTFTNTISGSVSSAGNMNADIYYSGSKIGTATGKFVGSSGSGSYTTSSTNGTWAATKK